MCIIQSSPTIIIIIIIIITIIIIIIITIIIIIIITIIIIILSTQSLTYTHDSMEPSQVLIDIIALRRTKRNCRQ
jgi:hypothetical protein